MRDDDLPQCRDMAAGEVSTIATAQAERLKMREDFGGAKGSRTPDLLNAIQALYQLS